MKTLFLDFDGVLFDTVKEAFLLSRCAFNNISPLKPINNIEYKRFHKFRYLITKSWHFYYIFKLIEEKINDFDFEEKYKLSIENSNHVLAKEFDKKYVRARESLIRTNQEFWDNLDEPYPFLYKIKELAENKNYRIIVLTNKKRLPVDKKLKKFNLNVELYANEDMINYSSKGLFINNYLRKNNITKAYFIEDSSSNLQSCSQYNNIVCLLVNWGYISPKEKGLSIEEILKEIEV